MGATAAAGRMLARGLGFAARVVLLVALLEGLASLALLGGALAARSQRPLAERAHTRYDPELGWVARPNLALVDLYGPGASLHTNGQGFRGTRDVAPAAPPGVVRIVCSGDSFALGYGVGDDDAWCRQLERLAPGVETVNMGQGGYGIDQAYLWYRRDGLPLEHHVHLFTFIGEDFVRMGATSFFGYGKPRLALDGDRLRVENVPVPRAPYWMPWLAQNASLAERLRVVQIGHALLGRPPPAPPASEAEIGRLATAVFRELAALHAAAGRRLVLVHLPTPEELRDDSSASLRGFVARQAERLDVPFLDGAAALQARPAAEVAALYIAPGDLDFPAAAGHFNERGNRWLAEWLLDSLRAHGVLTR